MIIEVVGFKKVDFVAQDSGNQIKGFNIFYTAADQDNVNGLEAGKIFLSAEKAKRFEITIGESYQVDYNRYGKIDSMHKI